MSMADGITIQCNNEAEFVAELKKYQATSIVKLTVKVGRMPIPPVPNLDAFVGPVKHTKIIHKQGYKTLEKLVMNTCRVW